ncbi:MAG: metal ABC transporter ATP-binding protein [Tannerella sp.]|jgi:zinc transport system ATP-binding protein|nr:metal ABC transporter ATP-binding protein [Tannerella sp.]
MNRLIEITHVAAFYEAQKVLQDVSLTLWENDFLVIVGPNGGGKTTLLKIILGLLKPAEGRVYYCRDGRPVSSLRIGYLPQINRIDKRFPISVREVIASGLMMEKKLLRSFTREQIHQLDQIIDLLELKLLAQRAIGELSGGELQRVLLGRAMVAHPEVLILDEPNTYMDSWFEQRLYTLLGEISRDTAIIVVSHELETMRPLAKRIVCINGTVLSETACQLSADSGR